MAIDDEVQGGSSVNLERQEGEKMVPQHKNGDGEHLVQGLTE
jgi:hypothetical protein